MPGEGKEGGLPCKGNRGGKRGGNRAGRQGKETRRPKRSSQAAGQDPNRGKPRR